MKKKIQKIVFIFVWFITASASATPSFSVYDLMVELAERPIGIETLEPHFSWKIYAQDRARVSVSPELTPHLVFKHQFGNRLLLESKHKL